MPMGTPLVSRPMKEASLAGTQLTWPMSLPALSQAVRNWLPLRPAVRPTWVMSVSNLATPPK